MQAYNFHFPLQCTLTHDELVQFTFEMFDIDKSGDIDKDELKE
jgi:Ca2+-binding EF-hand superfamily protein